MYFDHLDHVLTERDHFIKLNLKKKMVQSIESEQISYFEQYSDGECNELNME